MVGTGFAARCAAVAMVAFALTGGATAAMAATPVPYACYYNPTAPCYTATGRGGSIQDINPVDYVVGVGGAGSIAFANNDNGGTVSASAQGTLIEEVGGLAYYSATASLVHSIQVDYVSGPRDALVPMRIIAAAFHTPLASNGGGRAQYSATQQGRGLTGATAFAHDRVPETLFALNEIVYVKPDVPILINMQADSWGNHSVTVDPVYEIVGEFASRYRLSGLLSSTPAQAVPEPASWAMMILGFGAVGLSSRRRRTGRAVAVLG